MGQQGERPFQGASDQDRSRVAHGRAHLGEILLQAAVQIAPRVRERPRAKFVGAQDERKRFGPKASVPPRGEAVPDPMPKGRLAGQERHQRTVRFCGWRNAPRKTSPPGHPSNQTGRRASAVGPKKTIRTKAVENQHDGVGTRVRGQVRHPHRARTHGGTRQELNDSQRGEILQRLKVPDEVIWELLGFSPAQIAKWKNTRLSDQAATVANIATAMQRETPTQAQPTVSNVVNTNENGNGARA